MEQPQVLEGTGAELAHYLNQSPQQRFRVVSLEPLQQTEADVARPTLLFKATPAEREHALDAIAEMNRGLPILPPEAFERESLYADEERLKEFERLEDLKGL